MVDLPLSPEPARYGPSVGAGPASEGGGAAYRGARSCILCVTASGPPRCPCQWPGSSSSARPPRRWSSCSRPWQRRVARPAATGGRVRETGRRRRGRDSVRGGDVGGLGYLVATHGRRRGETGSGGRFGSSGRRGEGEGEGEGRGRGARARATRRRRRGATTGRLRLATMQGAAGGRRRRIRRARREAAADGRHWSGRLTEVGAGGVAADPVYLQRPAHLHPTGLVPVPRGTVLGTGDRPPSRAAGLGTWRAEASRRGLRCFGPRAQGAGAGSCL